MQKCIFYVAKNSKIFSKKVIIYYGVSGHGKGLVDAISGLGVKGPLRKVWCEDFSYFCADITKYLVAKFVDDDTKHHVHLKSCKIRKNRDNKNFLTINWCMQLDVIWFSPNGNVNAKANLWSCDACIECKFFESLVEKELYLIENSDVDSDEDLKECKISLRVRILKMNRMSFLRWDQILFLMWLRKMVW